MPDISDLRAWANWIRANKSTNYDDWRDSNLQVADVLMRHASIYDALIAENTTKGITIANQQAQVTLLTDQLNGLQQSNDLLQKTLQETKRQLIEAKNGPK